MKRIDRRRGGLCCRSCRAVLGESSLDCVCLAGYDRRVDRGLAGVGSLPSSVFIGDQIAAEVSASGTSEDPQGHGETVARELFPDVLPYVVGTPATYSFAGFNGRTLADNAPEAMLSLVAATAVPSGLKPSVSKQLRDNNFPYVVPA